MKSLRFVAVAVLSLLSALASVLPAAAVTGGEPDGDRHPNVGLILFYSPDGRSRCSATLVAPTVLVTAAHCTDDVVGRVLVSFASVIAERSPSPFPVAQNPERGYTQGEIEAAGHLSGTARTHPTYSDFTDFDNWNDVGVVILDEPVTGIAVSPLAPQNYLEAFAQPRLNSTLFEVVGYGVEMRKPEAGPQKPQPMSYPLIRRTTTSPGLKLTAQILQLNGNINDTRGGGGTCFGDSGGPVFLDGYLVAVTSFGYTANCRYVDGYQRLDIPVVQDWLRTAGVPLTA